MSVADIVTFVSAGIIGGALIQYPLGHLSDRWDRRSIILVTAAGAMTAALALAFLAGPTPLANFAFVFVFGSFAMPMFSLCAAHANDRAGPTEFVMLNAALMLFYSFGAIGGPFAASFAMERYGPSALFVFNAVIYAVFILIVIYRMRARSGVPVERRGRFVALLRTSTVFARLAGRPAKQKKPDA